MFPITATAKPLIIFGLTILLISTFGLFWIPPSQSSRFTTSPSRFPSLKPNTHPVTFHQRPEFFDLTPAGDANWTALLPPNGGFVSEKTGDGSYEMAGITMFHQLHCLQMIREAFQDLMEGKKVLETEMDAEEEEWGVGDVGREHGMRRKRHGPHLDQDHWVHCLDYLMQGILCAADDTIEFAHDTEEGGRAVDGYEVTHQCRSPEAIWTKVMGAHSTPGWKVSTDLKQRVTVPVPEE